MAVCCTCAQRQKTSSLQIARCVLTAESPLLFFFHVAQHTRLDHIPLVQGETRPVRRFSFGSGQWRDGSESCSGLSFFFHSHDPIQAP